MTWVLIATPGTPSPFGLEGVFFNPIEGFRMPP